MNLNPPKLLRHLGHLEAASFLILLLIAMPLKYAFAMPLAVRIVGSLHGLLFLVYLAVALLFTLRYRWKFSLFLETLIASLLPLGPFFLDRQLRQKESEFARTSSPSKSV